MKSALVVLGLTFLLVASIIFLKRGDESRSNLSTTNPNQSEPTGDVVEDAALKVDTISSGLETPWELVLLPEGSILITERKGDIHLMRANNGMQLELVATIESVKQIGEGGMLGMTIHPDFANNHFLYLYYTYQGSGNSTQNRVSRFSYTNNQLSDEQVIVDAIPGAANHNGGRIAFGPDNYLYITTGDAQEPSQAQNTDSLAGKILRVTDAGEVPPDNPFNNPVYSYGHRNPQGLAWDEQGNLWATEHGRSGIRSGYDELNLVEKGKNYGWPEIEGPETREGMVSPAYQSGPDATWAPAGLVYYNSSLYFTGLRGRSLYQAALDNQTVIDIKPYLTQQYGRLRALALDQDGKLLIATSNRDGRGDPIAEDDRIIKFDPDNLP